MGASVAIASDVGAASIVADAAASPCGSLPSKPPSAGGSTISTCGSPDISTCGSPAIVGLGVSSGTGAGMVSSVPLRMRFALAMLLARSRSASFTPYCLAISLAVSPGRTVCVVGPSAGTAVGVAVGATVDCSVGSAVGCAVGCAVGAAVGGAVDTAADVAAGTGVASSGPGMTSSWPVTIPSGLVILLARIRARRSTS